MKGVDDMTNLKTEYIFEKRKGKPVRYKKEEDGNCYVIENLWESEEKRKKKKITIEKMIEFLKKESKTDNKLFLNTFLKFKDLSKITEETPDTIISESEEDIKLIQLLKKGQIEKDDVKFIKGHKEVGSIENYGVLRNFEYVTYLVILNNGKIAEVYR